MPLIYAEIDSPLVFTRFQALPGDAAKPGYYPGVLIIQKGPAKGHFAVKDGNRVVNYQPSNPEHLKLQKFQIVIGDETLLDVVKCGNENEFTKCKLDHGSTVRDIVGDYSAFSMDGDKVRADLNLDNRLDGYGHAAALVDKFAKKIGNSIDFDYSYDIKGDVAIARCQKLNSVDIVDAPAATKSLFNENPTTPAHMPLDTKDLEAIGTLIETKLTAHKSEVATALAEHTKEISAKLAEGDGDKDAKDKDKDAKDKKDGVDAAQMSEIAEKAALAAVDKAFPKAQREHFAKLNDPAAGKSKFEQIVDTYVAQGAKNRGVAIQRAAKDHPAEYNVHMSAVNSASGTL